MGQQNSNPQKANQAIEFAMVIICFIVSIILVLGLIYGTMALNKKYNVWSAGMDGQAQLKQADWNRQIVVREANAKQQAAVYLAQAEVERAQGVAQANKIIGDSLKNNEDYLRYLWIDNLQNEKNQVIYVPTEANLPILEANRLSNPIQGAAK
jgi:regulator of protease activity HflC (stomatin/prohibitin superfamily)